MKDVSFIAAFPKSGITYLNYMLFHILFDRPDHVARIDSDYIFDVHESLARVPPPSETPRYVKTHFSCVSTMPLFERAARAVVLVRDPIDVMMSVWDFKHLLGEDGLLEAAAEDHAAMFENFCRHWVTTGGHIYPWAGSWVANVRSWLEQAQLPVIVVRYEQLKKQPVEELRRVLDFLGRPSSDQRIRAAVEASTVENMRKREAEEVNNRVSGAFYRPDLERGYAQGYRFVGRLNQDSYQKVLSPGARQYADQVFKPIMDRVRALSS
jgi:hypothetical protein